MQRGRLAAKIAGGVVELMMHIYLHRQKHDCIKSEINIRRLNSPHLHSFVSETCLLLVNERCLICFQQVSHPFACRKPTCPKCSCSKFPQSTKQQDTVSSKPTTATSPGMTPPNPRGDPGVTLHPSNPAHPVVTKGNQRPTSFSTFS